MAQSGVPPQGRVEALWFAVYCNRLCWQRPEGEFYALFLQPIHPIEFEAASLFSKSDEANLWTSQHFSGDIVPVAIWESLPHCPITQVEVLRWM
eukprot:2581740-Lingulodinium_polyedra.AAC.1